MDSTDELGHCVVDGREGRGWGTQLCKADRRDAVGNYFTRKLAPASGDGEPAAMKGGRRDAVGNCLSLTNWLQLPASTDGEQLRSGGDTKEAQACSGL